MRITLPGSRGAGRAGFRLGCVVAALRVLLPCGFMRTRISLIIRRKREVRVYTRQIARRLTGASGSRGCSQNINASVCMTVRRSAVRFEILGVLQADGARQRSREWIAEALGEPLA